MNRGFSALANPISLRISRPIKSPRLIGDLIGLFRTHRVHPSPPPPYPSPPRSSSFSGRLVRIRWQNERGDERADGTGQKSQPPGRAGELVVPPFSHFFPPPPPSPHSSFVTLFRPIYTAPAFSRYTRSFRATRRGGRPGGGKRGEYIERLSRSEPSTRFYSAGRNPRRHYASSAPAIYRG